MLVSAGLIAVFLWKVFQAWKKYSLGDTMIVSKVRQPEFQTFPSVTLCKGTFNLRNVTQQEIDEVIEGNSKLEKWLYTTSFDDEYDYRKEILKDFMHQLMSSE